jgi:hypothetical protein
MVVLYTWILSTVGYRITNKCITACGYSDDYVTFRFLDMAGKLKQLIQKR